MPSTRRVSPRYAGHQVGRVIFPPAVFAKKDEQLYRLSFFFFCIGN